LRDSKHNLKYWTRQSYLGFGVDAHSMLVAGDDLHATGVEAVRFATPDSLEGYSAANGVAARAEQLLASRTLVNAQAAIEESFFLGLRLNRGVSLPALKAQFGDAAVSSYDAVIAELVPDGLLEAASDRLRLTPRGRLLSNEVFAQFLREETIHHRDTVAQRSI
jgi:oxygen-independent coproporphyrinogen-3 oxidase